METPHGPCLQKAEGCFWARGNCVSGSRCVLPGRKGCRPSRWWDTLRDPLSLRAIAGGCYSPAGWLWLLGQHKLAPGQKVTLSWRGLWRAWGLGFWIWGTPATEWSCSVWTTPALASWMVSQPHITLSGQLLGGSQASRRTGSAATVHEFIFPDWGLNLCLSWHGILPLSHQEAPSHF